MIDGAFKNGGSLRHCDGRLVYGEAELLHRIESTVIRGGHDFLVFSRPLDGFEKRSAFSDENAVGSEGA